jgi:CBS domain-containing protein
LLSEPLHQPAVDGHQPGWLPDPCQRAIAKSGSIHRYRGGGSENESNGRMESRPGRETGFDKTACSEVFSFRPALKRFRTHTRLYLLKTAIQRQEGTGMFASDFMDTRFHALHPQQSIAEAISAFQTASQSEGKKIFGMMVTDHDQLVGILSMTDILNYVQPKHVAILGEMEDLDPAEVYRDRLNAIRSILVDDIMTTEVVTVRPDTHLMVIAEIMIKKHIRRLPVVEDQTVVGIVYVSDVFNRLMAMVSPDMG